MKKSLLALAILGAVSAPAFSQMVIFGKIDQSVGKPIGTAEKQVMDNAGSRIAFRGYEDLGGGMGAIFMMEHRFFPDTGAAATAATFWDGFSHVGLRTPYGTVSVGRQYTSAFLLVQNSVDPFAGEGVGALRNIAIGAGEAGAYAGPAKVRVSNSVKYANQFGPVAMGVDIAESTGAGGPDRPLSIAASYTGGPLWVGVAYEDAALAADDVLNVGVRFTFGITTLSGMYTTGSSSATQDVQAFLIGAKVKVGNGDIKAGYTSRKHEVVATGVSTTVRQRLGLGYDHNLSKRTKVYAQYGREGKIATNKTGYEVGMQHNF